MKDDFMKGYNEGMKDADDIAEKGFLVFFDIFIEMFSEAKAMFRKTMEEDKKKEEEDKSNEPLL